MGRNLKKDAIEMAAKNQRILENGFRIFAENTIEKVTMLDVAKAAGIAIGRSILVNEKMETNLPDIYAAGDCAEYNGVNYALWSQSVDQGKTAGGNAAGDDLSYETVDGALSFNGMGTSLFAIGDSGKDPKKRYRTIELKDERRQQYEKYTFENNRLAGVILIGDTSKLAKLTTQVKEHVKFSEVDLGL